VAAARSDPDNPPLDEYARGRMKRVPQVKVMRRALGLTQDRFAARFHIPLGTLRDWEQGKSLPDRAARAYLRVIAHSPETVVDALWPAVGQSGHSASDHKPIRTRKT
jgi:putative transcriptional regulator